MARPELEWVAVMRRLVACGMFVTLLGACSWALAQDSAPAKSEPRPAAAAEPSAPEPAAAPPRKSADPDVASARAGSETPAAAPKKESDAAKKLGLDFSSDAPLEIDSRLIDIIDAGGGGERVRFSGGVELKQGTLKLTCAVLDAFYPDGAQGQPQRIVAEGEVKVEQGDVELRCTRAEFDKSNCVTLCRSSESCESETWPEQPARLRRGDDWIEGRELQFDLCTGALSARCGARMKVKPKAEPAPPAPEPTGANAP